MRAPRHRSATALLCAVALLLAACGEDADPAPVATPVADGGVLRASPLDDPTGDEPTDDEDADPDAGPTDDPSGDAPDDGEGAGDDPEGDDATDGETDGEADDEATDGEAADDEPRDPTDADRARFVADYRPDDASDVQHVAEDVDGDGQRDLVFAWVGTATGASHVAVVAWDGTAYGVAFEADGGPADRLARIRVADLNLDGTAEVVVPERRGDVRSSATVWSIRRPDDVRALVAVGGCHDGSATYGVVGVTFVRAADGTEEIHATCDESPLPPDVWGSDVYVWADGAYRERSTLEPPPDEDPTDDEDVA